MTAEIVEIKELEEFEEVDKKSFPLYTLFDPFRKIIILFGFYVGNLALKKTKLEKFCCVLRWIATSLKIALLCLHLVCLFIRQLRLGFQIDSAIVWPMTETVWTVEALISIFYLIYWQQTNYTRNLAECLNYATSQQGIKKSYKRLQLLLKICLGASGCFVAVILLSNATSSFTSTFRGSSDPNFNVIYFGVDWLSYLSWIAVLYLSAGWCLTTVLYGFFCKCLLTEFKNINDSFKLEQNLNKESMEKYLKMFSSMRFVVDKANSTFSSYIMLMLFCNIVVVVITLYAALTSPFLGVGYIFVGSWLVASFIQIWAFSWLPADVNDEVLTHLSYIIFYRRYNLLGWSIW